MSNPLTRPSHIDCQRCGASVRDTRDDSLWARHARWHRDLLHIAERLEARHPLPDAATAGTDRTPPSPNGHDADPVPNGHDADLTEQEEMVQTLLGTTDELRRFLFGDP